MSTLRRIFLTLTLVFGLAVPTVAAAAPGDPPQARSSRSRKAPMTTFPFNATRHTLANGLGVVLVPMNPGSQLVSYWTIVQTGSRDEVEPGVTGFAHFFEHMMFRGSKRFPAAVYDGIVKEMGADANAYTTDDYTAYHLSLTTPDLARAIVIEADRFQHLSYDEAAFKTEAGAVYGEFRKGRTDPWEVLFETLSERAFDQHTYRHTTIGYESDVKDMPNQYAYSKQFFERFYRPDNCVVVVVGDFDAQATLATLKREYGGWKAGYKAPAVPVEPEQRAMRRVDVGFEGSTLPLLAVMWKGARFAPGDRTMVAAKLVGALALGETSALYKKLVLEEQRVEALEVSVDFQKDPGLWGAFVLVKDPADAGRVEREVIDAVLGLATGPIDEVALEAAKSRLKYGFLAGLESPSRVAGAVARMVALTGDVKGFDTYYQTLSEVTAADVARAAATYFTEERLTVARLASAGVVLPAPAARAPVHAAPIPAAVTELPVASDPSVAIRVWVKAGSAMDPAGKEGLAELTARLLSEGGTQRRSYDAILATLYPMAAGYGATVDKEMTVFEAHGHRDFAEQVGRALTDALVRPAWNEADFERVRASMVSALEHTLRFSSDEELGKAGLYQSVFQGTPYGHLALGRVGALKALTVADAQAFWAAHYSRDQVVVGVGGGYPEGFGDLVARLLGELPAGSGAPSTPKVKPAPIQGRNALIIEKEGSSTAISFGWPIDLIRGSREFYALYLATSWLGEHRNSASHLFQVIREQRGMNYGDYAYIEAFPNGGSRVMPPTGVGRRQQIAEIWIRPVPDEQAVFAFRAALREVELLAQNGLSEAQFKDAQAFLTKYVLHYAETTGRRLGYALDDRFYGLGALGDGHDGHLERLRRILPTLTRAEVNAAIQKHFKTDAFWVSFVTADGEALKAALVRGAPSVIRYPEGVEKPAEILKEDELIGSWPLKLTADRVQVVPVTHMFE